MHSLIMLYLILFKNAHWFIGFDWPFTLYKTMPGTSDHSSEQLDMSSALMRRKSQTHDFELNHNFDG